MKNLKYAYIQKNIPIWFSDCSPKEQNEMKSLYSKYILSNPIRVWKTLKSLGKI